MLRLSSIFSDGMIFQRDTCDNVVWGYSEPLTDVTVSLVKLHTKHAEGLKEEVICSDTIEADQDGYFEVELTSCSAGGNYTLEISDHKKVISIKDITFGDVFICGGQSNMELPINRTMERYEEEIKTASDKKIRYFKIPEKYNFHHTEDLIEGGKWITAEMPELTDMGSVAYFTAKHLREFENVPIGIYNTAIGGTPIKSWVSEETMRKLRLHVEEFNRCLDDNYIKGVVARDQAADVAWRNAAFEPYKTGETTGEKGVLTVPGWFDTIAPSLAGRNMSILVERDIEIPEDWSDKDVKLYLGAIIDSDMVYVNGTLVGETGYLYPPRIYHIPKGVLKKGLNHIEIRMLVFRCEGGFMPGKEYKLHSPEGVDISLEGEWNYEVKKEMPYIPNMTFFSYAPTGVYNGMIYPLRRQKNLGVFFYQGESNVEEYPEYKLEFEAMINDWRKLWDEPELPVMYVQIASFSNGRKEFGIKRVLLTEGQRQCMELPNTAMIQAYDLGEYNDLHPTNKKEVGRRLAVAAEALVYGKGIYTPGPDAKDVICKKGEVTVKFGDNVKLSLGHGFGVIVGDDRDEVNIRGFEVFSHGKRFAAEAEFVSENEVTVRFPEDVQVEAIGYAWNDCPLEANLYDENQLPVVPFYKKI
jgi:sialate O-acetylesterase